MSRGESNTRCRARVSSTAPRLEPRWPRPTWATASTMNSRISAASSSSCSWERRRRSAGQEIRSRYIAAQPTPAWPRFDAARGRGRGQTAAVGIDLERVVRAQQQGCAIGGSALYTRILDDVAADVVRGGPCRAVLAAYGDEPLAAAWSPPPPGRRPRARPHRPGPGPGPPLPVGRGHARGRTSGPTSWPPSPSTGPSCPSAPAAPIQTNEVGRSASLLGGFLAVAEAGLPLRVLEVGASAGLNLRFDRYRYEAAGGPSFGPGGLPGPVRRAVGRCRAPDLGVALVVAERRGCDVRPLDPADPADRLRLRACLWPDQPERRARLDAALEVAEPVPVPVDRADAAAWAGRAPRRGPPRAGHGGRPLDRGPVPRPRHPAGPGAGHRRGRPEPRAPDAPVAWLRMEPASTEEADVRLTCWPSGRAGPKRRSWPAAPSTAPRAVGPGGRRPQPAAGSGVRRVEVCVARGRSRCLGPAG